MTETLVIHIRLQRAMLCLECEALFDIGPAHCPACGDAAMIPLQSLLENNEGKETQ